VIPISLTPPQIPMAPHSPRGPSGYARDLGCPRSSLLIERLPWPVVIESIAADRGSAEHVLAEQALRAGITPEAIEDGEYAGSGLAARLFVDTVRETVATSCEPLALWAEVQLDGRHLHPDFYGTADALLLSVDNRGRHVLDVFDLKTGTWPVDADSLQLQLYARLALTDPRLCEPMTEVNRIRATIVQPWRLPRDRDGRQVFRASFHRDAIIESTDAYLNNLSAITAALRPEAVPIAAGHWCHFCPMRLAPCAEHERWQAEQRAIEIYSDFAVIEDSDSETWRPIEARP
jgi:hypothetical protein